MSEIAGGFGGGRDSLSRMVGGKLPRIRSLLSVSTQKLSLMTFASLACSSNENGAIATLCCDERVEERKPTQGRE